MPRLFTALEIPASLRTRLSLMRAPLGGAKWVEPENMHITLRFAGDIDGRTADEFADQLAAFLPADLIPRVVEGIYQAFSLAIADSFWLGLVATLVALVVTAVALPETALRGFDRSRQPGQAPGDASGAARADAPLGFAE